MPELAQQARMWPMIISESSPNPQSLLGGRYRIIRQIGAGGMAEVFLARDTNLDRNVAIKQLRDEMIADPTFRERFLQEARAAANLSHPNIVTIHDFGHDAGRYFIVMEHVQGVHLKQYIRQKGALRLQESVDLMVQISAGVGYAHRAGLVHCDLKPQNILVAPDGRVKITDFGIARALATITEHESHSIIWGTPHYLAPEIASGGAPSPASDVYALGIVLYEMLTGRLPFDAADTRRIAELQLAASPPPPRKINPDIPENLELLLLKVLAKEPAARYRNADQFGRVLTSFSSQLDIKDQDIEIPQYALEVENETRALPAAKPGLDWLAILLALGALLALGGLIPLWMWACFLYPACPLPVP